MVNNVINATYTETYDINTAVGELSLLGIHTPTSQNLIAQYKGFFQQYKKVKILGCDIGLACASTQALDPTQLGIGAGGMDPRDVMNPILFKACTGEKLNMLLEEIYSQNATNAVSQGSLHQVFETRQEALDAYYSMLSDDSFRKAHPQSGMIITGLKPLVHKIVATMPFNKQGNGYDTQIAEQGGVRINPLNGNIQNGSFSAPNQSGSLDNVPIYLLNRGTTDYPAMDTTIPRTITEKVINSSNNVVNEDITKEYMITGIPRTYMGVFVLPPAITQRLFFRMSIRWHIQFMGFRPCLDVLPLKTPSGLVGENQDAMDDTGKFGYYELYHNATPNSKAMNKDYGSFTTNSESEVTKILEKSQ